jgi:lipopolysaccharide export LptBFGC system permease protein LptF
MMMDYKLRLLFFRRLIVIFVAALLISVTIVTFYNCANLSSKSIRWFGEGLPITASLGLIYYSLGWILAAIIPLAYFVSSIVVYAHFPYENIVVYEQFEYKITESEHLTFNYFTLTLPTLLVSLFLSLGFYVFNDMVLPKSNYSLKLYQISINRFYVSNDSLRAFTLDKSWTDKGGREMSRSMLRGKIKEYQSQLNATLNDSRQSEKNKEIIINTIEREITSLESEIQKRYWISVSILFFGWLGGSIGFLMRKTNVFFLALIGSSIFYFYWYTFGVIVKICSRGDVWPMAIWIPCLCITVIGSICAFSAGREFSNFISNNNGKIRASKEKITVTVLDKQK